MDNNKHVFVTGASGLLGREIMKKFREENWKTSGTAFSRAEKYKLIKLDLTNFVDVKKTVTDLAPSIIIHSAAQRSPDEVENHYDESLKLNVEATKFLAEIAGKNGIPLLYISTDYVFDGKSPPYKETDQTSPSNKYGMTKLEGETVTLKENPGNIVLRIPVLYGEVEYPGESAVTCLLDCLLNKKPQKISDYEIRWPAHVNDIATICYKLAEKKLAGENISGIYQWSGKEPITKYKMVQIIAEELSLSADHISGDKEPNAKVPRPQNCQLDTQRLQNLGIEKHTPFNRGIKECLIKFVQK